MEGPPCPSPRPCGPPLSLPVTRPAASSPEAPAHARAPHPVAATHPVPARVVSLDMLRAAAVFLVMARHLGMPAAEVPWLQEPLEGLVRGGWVGVDLFFVLSGFLIGGLIFREHARHGELRVGRFLVRRGLKIYPPFYAFIAVTLLIGWAAGEPAPARHRLLGELLYLQNYWGALWSHTWSLAVEEHFYILLPLLLLGIRERGGSAAGAKPFRRLPWLAGLVMAGALLLRLANHAAGAPYSVLSHLVPTHLRIDAMMFGVLLAWLHHEYPEPFHASTRRFWPILLGVGVLALLPPFFFALGVYPFIHTWGLALNYLGAGCVVLGVLGWEGARVRRRGVLAYVGLYSYSIYLWHMPVMEWIMPRVHTLTGVGPGSIASLALFALLSCLAGIGAARLVEFPVLRLRDRFFPSRSGVLVPSFAGEGMGPHHPPVTRETPSPISAPG